MNTGLMNAIAATDDKAQYDACAKRLIGQKIVLAHILVRTVDEFKGMRPEEVVACIEGEPQIGIVPIDSGMTNNPGSQDADTKDKANTSDNFDMRTRSMNCIVCLVRCYRRS